MKVILAFLADHAVAHDDGKVYVIGGGVDRIQVPQFPAIWPSLALVVKLAFQPAEYGSPITIELRGASAASGTAISAPRRLSIQPAATPYTVGDSVPFPFVHNMRDLRFPEEGLYRFEVLANNVEMVRVELAVVGAAGASEVTKTNELLRGGFTAFREGDHDAAQAIFRAVIVRQPDLGVAHNNLGFTLLAQQDPDGAQREFDLAASFGFGSADVMVPNLACCAYLKGTYDQAAQGFVEAMSRGWPSDGTFLMLISPGGMLHPMLLRSAGDYTALMAINAAWSQLQRGDLESSIQLAAIAEAGPLTIPRDSDEHGRFTVSLSELQEQIRLATVRT